MALPFGSSINQDFTFIDSDSKKSESLQTEGRHFRSMICKFSDV